MSYCLTDALTCSGRTCRCTYTFQPCAWNLLSLTRSHRTAVGCQSASTLLLVSNRSSSWCELGAGAGPDETGRGKSSCPGCTILPNSAPSSLPLISSEDACGSICLALRGAPNTQPAPTTDARGALTGASHFGIWQTLPSLVLEG